MQASLQGDDELSTPAPIRRKVVQSVPNFRHEWSAIIRVSSSLFPRLFVVASSGFDHRLLTGVNEPVDDGGVKMVVESVHLINHISTLRLHAKV